MLCLVVCSVGTTFRCAISSVGFEKSRRGLFQLLAETDGFFMDVKADIVHIFL